MPGRQLGNHIAETTDVLIPKNRHYEKYQRDYPKLYKVRYDINFQSADGGIRNGNCGSENQCRVVIDINKHGCERRDGNCLGADPNNKEKKLENARQILIFSVESFFKKIHNSARMICISYCFNFLCQ